MYAIEEVVYACTRKYTGGRGRGGGRATRNRSIDSARGQAAAARWLIYLSFAEPCFRGGQENDVTNDLNCCLSKRTFDRTPEAIKAPLKSFPFSPVAFVHAFVPSLLARSVASAEIMNRQHGLRAGNGAKE